MIQRGVKSQVEVSSPPPKSKRGSSSLSVCLVLFVCTRSVLYKSMAGVLSLCFTLCCATATLLLRCCCIPNFGRICKHRLRTNTKTKRSLHLRSEWDFSFSFLRFISFGATTPTSTHIPPLYSYIYAILSWIMYAVHGTRGLLFLFVFNRKVPFGPIVAVSS